MIRILLFAIFLVSCSKESKTFTAEDAAVFESTVKGTVQTKTGPMSGVLVVANPGGYTTVSGLDGSYTLSQLRSGRYSIQFLKEDYRDTITSDTVNVGLREEVAIKPVKLKYRYATIKGKVENANGEAEIGAGIVVEEQQGGTTSQSAGKFSLAKIEPGKVRLFSVVQGKGYGFTDVALEADTIVENITISLDKRGGVVIGSVVDQDGKPVSKASIDAYQGAIKATTNSAGEFEITEVPKEGNSRIQIGKGENQTYCGGMNLQGNDTLRIGNIVLSEKPDAEIIVPFSTHLATTADTTMLVMPWSSESDSIVPLWYYWSFDDEKTWITTTEPRLQVVPASLGWNAGSYTVRVRCATMDSTQSNTASIIVKVSGPDIGPGISSSETITPQSSTSLNSSSRISSSTSTTVSSSTTAKSSASTGTKPVIDIGALDTVSVCIGKRYVEPGFIVTDDKDTNLAAAVVVDSSKLNKSALGTYPIYYYVKDSDNLSDTAVRIVKVERWAYLSQNTNDSLVVDDFEEANGNWITKDTSNLITYISTIRLAEGVPVHSYSTSGWFSYTDSKDGGSSYFDPSIGGDQQNNKPIGTHRIIRSISGSDTNYAEHVTFHKGTVGDSQGNFYGGIGVYFPIYELNDPNALAFPPLYYYDVSNLQAVSFDARGTGTVCAFFTGDLQHKAGNDGWGTPQKCITLTSAWNRYVILTADLQMDPNSNNIYTWTDQSARVGSFELKTLNGANLDLYLDNLTFYGIGIAPFMTSLPSRY